MIYGITFNGKHSFNDFGLYIEKKTINPPAKTKILETVPYMNSKYDFSTVGSGGEQVFDTRTITVKLALVRSNMAQLHTVYSQALEWLMDCGQSKLIFDFMPDYYFLAEVQEAPKLDDFMDNGDLEINFVCEPFKYGVDFEGDDNWLWDDFNFETDIVQEVTYNINVVGEFGITNTGRPVCPIINSSSTDPLTIKFENTNKNYTLKQGDNKFYDLKLQTGYNSFGALGVGTVKFIFRKETL